MANFYKRLSYSFGNEDWKTEQKALNIQSTDNVFAVAASGDRPLNLLLSDCAHITAIDANPFQTALCDLKRAAMNELDYEQYIKFLGIAPCDEREKTLKKIENSMEENATVCWRSHLSKVKNGVLYEGALEKGMQKVAFLAKLWQGPKIKHLFSFDDVDEQRKFIDKNWNFNVWKNLFRLALNPFVTRYLIKDPGLYAHVDQGISAPEYIHGRMSRALREFLAKENIVLSLYLQGTVHQNGFTPYIQEDGFNQIKKRLHKLSIKTENAITYLENVPEKSIDVFSFSDIASYMKREDFHRLCRALYRAAKPNARFCIREFMSAHNFPPELAKNFVCDHKLEKELENEDRCFVYRFKVGKINKF